MTKFNLREHKQELEASIDNMARKWHDLAEAERLTEAVDETIIRHIDCIDMILRHMPDENGMVWLNDDEMVVVAIHIF